MTKGRMEAFSDGVIAVITIMVLEMKAPRGGGIAALQPPSLDRVRIVCLTRAHVAGSRSAYRKNAR